MLLRPELRSADAPRPHEFRAILGQVELHRLMKSSRRKLHQPDHLPHQPSAAVLNIELAFGAKWRHVRPLDLRMERSERGAEQGFIRRANIPLLQRYRFRRNPSATKTYAIAGCGSLDTDT